VTEGLVRVMLKAKGYYDGGCLVEEQKSKNPRVQKLLENASKNGDGVGRPEFIITFEKYSDLIVIIECKASIKDHRSDNLDRAKDYAVDGALHYASYLSKEFDVIAVGVSGQNVDELMVNSYFWARKDTTYKELTGVKGILSLREYREVILEDSGVRSKKEAELMEFARDLHNKMRDYAKISESEKPLLVSAVLMALEDRAFVLGYRGYDKASDLSRAVTNAIERVLSSADMPDAKVKNLVQTYGFLNIHPELNRGSTLKELIMEIEKNIKPFMEDFEHIDVIGRFYGEFLKYTGGDGKGLGIVLTPRHITELFSELANLSEDSVVLDICQGTGSFLISAMNYMIKKAGGDLNKISSIRRNQLIGVEQQPTMYALGVANMLLRGDGKANVYLGSCFDYKEQIRKHRPNYLFLNPPYSQKGEGLSELDFVEFGLSCLEPGGMGFAIVPMSCALDVKNPIRKRILEKHTLEAVMSMPDDLFYPVGVVTVIMVFRAHVPHSKYFETWFGYWKDDGFEKTRTNGRCDVEGLYESKIKKEWLEMYHGRKVIAGKSAKKHVTAEDEWVAEAYLETDYSVLTKEDFEKELKKYMLFKLLNEDLEGNEYD